MNTYDVISKATGGKVYEYRADAPIEWGGMEFAGFDHVLVASDAGTAPAAPAPVYGGRRELTKLEFRALFSESEKQAVDRLEATFEVNQNFTDAQKDMIRTAYKDYNAASFVGMDDPRTAAGLNLYVMLGFLAQERVSEILNG